jgi:hypothetical protein
MSRHPLPRSHAGLGHEARSVDMFMPGYIAQALTKFQPEYPKCLQHAPRSYVAPTYGAPAQVTSPADDSAPLPPPSTGLTNLQEITGTLLHYAHATLHKLSPSSRTSTPNVPNTHRTTMQHRPMVHRLNYRCLQPSAHSCNTLVPSTQLSSLPLARSHPSKLKDAKPAPRQSPIS